MNPPDAQDQSTVKRTIRCRLYPTPKQERVLERHCADARFVWNAALEQFNYWRRGGSRSPTSKERSQQLTEARREFSWLAEGSRTVQQMAKLDFEQACKNWWSGTHRRPTWRKRSRTDSFGCQGTTVYRVSRKWAHLSIPKAGKIKLRAPRQLPQDLTSADAVVRVTQDGKGRWHACFSIEVPIKAREAAGAVVGVDMGVTNTIATSDGQMLRAPSMPKRKQQRLKALQRQLERQERNSARREKTRRRIAALHQGQRDRRRNWTEVQTIKLARTHDLVAVEDLSVGRMVRRPNPRPDPERLGHFLHNGAAQKAGLNRSISQQGWGEFRRRLEDKAETSGAHVVAVPARNTSRECHACGHVAAENRKSQAFLCVACGHEAHADRNAAENVLARALAPASTPGSGARSHRAPARRSRSGAARTSRGTGADA